MKRSVAISTHQLSIGYSGRGGKRVVRPDLNLQLFTG